jgi:endonuclease YncB( thermonuclease family)
MAVKKKGKTAEKKVSSFILGKIIGRSFLVIFLLICGGIIFNLDRLTGSYDYKDYLPSIITKWLPLKKAPVQQHTEIPEAVPGSEKLLIGKVVNVYDGDTLTMVSGQGINARKCKIRFFGIDAPEAKQDYGINARDSLREKVLNKEIKVEVVSIDRYQRYVGKIFVGSRYINREMVSEGSAWYYPDYAEHEKDLEAAQMLAKESRSGLWQSSAPQPPWLYRKEMRKR